MNKLQDKIALVTGGNSGIGLATAHLFAREGARVIITGRDQATLDDAARRIGPSTLAVRSDVRQLADLDALFAQIKEKFGRLDVVFANAGVLLGAPLADSTEQLYHEVFDANVKGVFFTIQKALPLLADGAAVVINASAAVHSGDPGIALYSASKAAALQLARNLGGELSPRRIRVNAVSPGLIRTALPERAGYSAEQAAGMYESYSPEIPLRRAGQAEEIACAVLFLASDDSSFMTGEEVVVDGGRTSIGAAGVQR